MLIGYDKEGEIKFIFTDEKYLEKKYPNNTAKISNFWGIENHGLTELFIPIVAFEEWDNAKDFKIIEGKLTRKNPKRGGEAVSSVVNKVISNKESGSIIELNRVD